MADKRLIIIDPLLMNAFNNVNLAGACLLTSTQYAKELGIPEDRWIYPLGGAGTSDSPDCEYPSPHSIITKSNQNSLETTKLPFKPSNLSFTR